MKSKIIIGIVAAVAVLGGGYTVSRMDFIGTGKVGILVSSTTIKMEYRTQYSPRECILSHR